MARRCSRCKENEITTQKGGCRDAGAAKCLILKDEIFRKMVGARGFEPTGRVFQHVAECCTGPLQTRPRSTFLSLLKPAEMRWNLLKSGAIVTQSTTQRPIEERHS